MSYHFHEIELLQEVMGILLGWLRAGRINPPPVTLVPFDEVAAAHRAIESGTTVGKVVLTCE